MHTFDLATVIWVVGGLVLAGWVVGGFLVPVAGQWRDRDRIVQLGQLGPWVWGTCQVPGGLQRYRGKVFLGHLTLTRRDFGQGHLLGLGFNDVQAQAVEGQVMVRLTLRMKPSGLHGHLWGTRFQFNPRTQQVLSMQSTPAEERVWVPVP
ncbi:MAG: hypothetical protein VX834_10215 [Myxococcota bacterium]|nr:hypothetical protein [Myxococcota bacterium]